MPLIIKPTVGRKVWYYVGHNHPEMNTLSYQPCDATVLYVHSDDCVNLLIVDHLGHQHFVDRAPLIQPDAPIGAESYAEWPSPVIEKAREQAEPPTPAV